MSQVLAIVNPRRARAKRRKSGRKASPAQMAARARFAAMARARSTNPRKRARRRNPVVSTVRASNPRRRRYGARARRRNPRSMSLGSRSISLKSALSNPVGTLKPAAIGAIGALTVNSVIARLPLPAQLLTGDVRFLTQAAIAVGLGALASRMGAGAPMAAKMVEGSLTLTMVDFIRSIAARAGIQLGNVGYYLPGVGASAIPGYGSSPARNASGMGRYLTGPGSNNVIPMRTAGMGGMGNQFVSRPGTGFNR